MVTKLWPLLLLLACSCVGPLGTLSLDPVSIYGQVTDANTGAPIEGAVVEWRCADCPWKYRVETDATGWYTCSGPDHTGHRICGIAGAVGYMALGKFIEGCGPSPFRSDFPLTPDNQRAFTFPI